MTRQAANRKFFIGYPLISVVVTTTLMRGYPMKNFLFAACLVILSSCHLVTLSSCRAGEVVATPDLAYASADSEKNKLDLFFPKGAKDVPVVMFIHGGGYRR